jgi:hypothetical protein
MIRFAAPELTYWADRRRDGSEFEERSARSRRCRLDKSDRRRRAVAVAGPAPPGSTAQLRRSCPDAAPTLEHGGVSGQDHPESTLQEGGFAQTTRIWR